MRSSGCGRTWHGLVLRSLRSRRDGIQDHWESRTLNAGTSVHWFDGLKDWT